MQWKLIGLVLLLLQVSAVAAERWIPVLKFSVEDSGYEKSLIFISGLSYGLTYSVQYLAEGGGKNFYCLASRCVTDSDLIVDLLIADYRGLSLPRW